MEERDKLESIRTGYQAAVSLWAYEGALIWSKFTAMIYANTIVLATIGLLITSKAELKVLRIGLAVLGIVLCGAWFLIIKRSYVYHNHWVSSAHDLEKQLGADMVKTFAQGQAIKPSGPKVEHVTYLVIGLFMVIYILTLLPVAWLL